MSSESPRTPRPVRRLGLVMAAAAFISASGLIGIGAAAHASTSPSGSVRVLSAGSLTNIMTLLSGKFKADTGYTLQDMAEGSSAIASGIVSKTLQGDVFISASPSADVAIEGSKNGDWINGYHLFGSSPDVLAYYPKSKFAVALRSRPWFDVVSQSGFELGRTDPAVDPSGILDLDALYGIGYGYDIPSLLAVAHRSGNVYPETAIPGLLQAGQLDGGFMYAISAHAAKLPFVTLTGTKNLSAHFTVAALKGAPDPAPARAFVKWLLGPSGRAVMRHQGLLPLIPARFVPSTG